MNNELDFIKKYNIPVVKIDPKRNYWLVRTNAGEYFEEFYLGDFIGINWNEFSDPLDFTDVHKEDTTINIADTYKENKQPGHTYSQIKRFFHEIKIGDIIMIPSKNSKHIGFGEVSSDVFISKNSQTEIDEGECTYEKRRSVKWLKTVERKELDPYLYKMMSSHLTISNANDYADSIDRTLHTFYYKGDKAHLVLKVNQDNDIPLMDLLNGLTAPLELVELINNPANSADFKKNDLDAKLRVQSRGLIELVSSGDAFLLVILLGVAIVGLVGGKFRVDVNKEKIEGELSTEGLLEKILKFKQLSSSNKAEKQLHEKTIKEIEEKLLLAMDKLEMVTPKELDRLIETPMEEVVVNEDITK